ncbi:helix-turn-helix domain-containing protein [Bifidobacterium pullorum subsp. saeculare]|uniref:Helix-turn-helix domain-containing protein n=2 Tax=Bifidobacterium pullorum TaxID=78448 RepID=A0A938WVW9_9BIFI|nr:helix-turn-helix domain-containing protein [Bifidobacterium pullorum subsp. saeculare]
MTADFEARDFLAMLGDGRDPETVVFECLASGLADARVASLLAVVGWDDGFDCFAIGGRPRVNAAGAAERIRSAARDLGGSDAIVGTRDGWVVAVLRRQNAVGPEVAATTMADAFADDRPLCLGPLRHGVAGAAETLRGTLYALAAAPAMPDSPRPMRADDLLPERALLGDDAARRELVEAVYGSLDEAGPNDPTMLTVSTFLASGGSLETTAKELSVHPNTVRYRLKRAAESTGWDATDPRDAYVLTTAIALGRIHAARAD